MSDLRRDFEGNGKEWAAPLNKESDEDLIEILKAIDENEDLSVTDWEAEFLDRIKKMPKPRQLTDKQKKIVYQMKEKYLES